MIKEKEIVSGLRTHLDGEMAKLHFEFNKKLGNYIKYDSQQELYFEVSLLFLNFVASETNHTSKYLEIYVNIYHVPTSKLLLEVTTRGKNLDSFFYFKTVGNMLSDIVLNPDWCNYTSRNNHKYFKLGFVTEEDIKDKSEEIIGLLHKHITPFFENLNTLHKIKNALDCSYRKDIAIHNVSVERLLSLVALLYHFKDPLKGEKIQQIRDYFISVNHPTAIAEMDVLIRKVQGN